MACSAPTSASEVFCRAAKCNRWSARFALVAAVVVTFVLAPPGTEFVHNSTSGNVGAVERIVAHCTHFTALLVLQFSLLFVARRRLSASHHAAVKANNLKALELLAAAAPDEATKKDILARSVDLVAGKPGCCK